VDLTFALFSIVGLHGWDQLRLGMVSEPADQTGFTFAQRSGPAFAVSLLELLEKSEVYEVFRHPEGGRKDVLHWGSPPGKAGGRA
jgi:hypothetical protein